MRLKVVMVVLAAFLPLQLAAPTGAVAPDSLGEPPRIVGDRLDDLAIVSLEAPPPTDFNTLLVVPILRERLDGTMVPALHILKTTEPGADPEYLASHGIPVVSHEVAATSGAEGLRDQAVPYERLVEVLMRAEQGDVGAASHPATPITDSTSLPVTAYADGAEQREADWYSYIIQSFDAADSLLASDATVNVHRLTLMTTGTPVDDVSTYCHMQQTARYEAGFAPHVGTFIVIFSPGDIEGNWGVAIDGPISKQYENGNWNRCTSPATWKTPHDIPSAYVRHAPLFYDTLTSMQHLTAHEMAHQFGDEHALAWCDGTFHIHKTNEAFTSGSDTPGSCGENWNPASHYHWDYSDAGVASMKAQRKAWTRCYNGGGCFWNADGGTTSGWALSGLWHATDRRWDTATKSFWYGQASTGNYNTGSRTTGSLVTPWISLPSGSPKLHFASWYRTEDTGTSWDTKKVFISTDGSTWTQLHQVSGTDQTWIWHQVSLSSYAGMNVRLDFRFDSVDSVNNAYEGWYVDDILITRS